MNLWKCRVNHQSLYQLNNLSILTTLFNCFTQPDLIFQGCNKGAEILGKHLKIIIQFWTPLLYISAGVNTSSISHFQYRYFSNFDGQVYEHGLKFWIQNKQKLGVKNLISSENSFRGCFRWIWMMIVPGCVNCPWKYGILWLTTFKIHRFSWIGISSQVAEMRWIWTFSGSMICHPMYPYKWRKFPASWIWAWLARLFGFQPPKNPHK